MRLQTEQLEVDKEKKKVVLENLEALRTSISEFSAYVSLSHRPYVSAKLESLKNLLKDAPSPSDMVVFKKIINDMVSKISLIKNETDFKTTSLEHLLEVSRRSVELTKSLSIQKEKVTKRTRIESFKMLETDPLEYFFFGVAVVSSLWSLLNSVRVPGSHLPPLNAAKVIKTFLLHKKDRLATFGKFIVASSVPDFWVKMLELELVMLLEKVTEIIFKTNDHIKISTETYDGGTLLTFEFSNPLVYGPEETSFINKTLQSSQVSCEVQKAKVLLVFKNATPL